MHFIRKNRLSRQANIGSLTRERRHIGPHVDTFPRVCPRNKIGGSGKPPLLFLFISRAKTEHPANAELVGQHSETPAPERIVQWHGDLTVFTEGPEYFLHFRLGLTVQAD